MRVQVSMRILFLFLLLSTTSLSQKEDILVVGNFSSLCLPDSVYTTIDSLPESLDSVKVLMLFSSSTSNLSHSDIDRIEEYVRKGGGLYSGSDNWPLQAQSNQVTHQLYLKESFGNYQQTNAELNKDGNLDLDEIDTIPAGETTAAFPLDYRLKVEAWVQDQPLISSGSIGEGKIIIDGGYSRFYCAHRSESTDALLEQFIIFLSTE
jgi:hypothetical protein